MKYLLVGFLSLAAFLNAGPDDAIAGALAAALIALQLRRRQKSLRMPRPLN
ncbi:MAG TPA: hypothetical protein VFU13_01265 [Steroidobacteraceae bacterium]|nr:hypothetical protein [Steroidobacteraceae bacterium]